MDAAWVVPVVVAVIAAGGIQAVIKLFSKGDRGLVIATGAQASVKSLEAALARADKENAELTVERDGFRDAELAARRASERKDRAIVQLSQAIRDAGGAIPAFPTD